jgi:hypothetical protein
MPAWEETKIPHLNQWLGVVVHACHPIYDREAQIEELCVGWPRNNGRSYLKNNQCKKDWGRSLSSRVKAPSSTPQYCRKIFLKNCAFPSDYLLIQYFS